MKLLDSTMERELGAIDGALAGARRDPDLEVRELHDLALALTPAHLSPMPSSRPRCARGWSRASHRPRAPCERDLRPRPARDCMHSCRRRALRACWRSS